MPIDDLKEKLEKAFDPEMADKVNIYKSKMSELSRTIDKG